ncbi:MAG: hypothetical protein ABIO96_00145 [Nitrospiraceae bacterium]
MGPEVKSMRSALVLHYSGKLHHLRRAGRQAYGGMQEAIAAARDEFGKSLDGKALLSIYSPP